MSIFLSVDPLAEKYPGINPYVANNPINAIDPDGRDFRMITQRNSSGQLLSISLHSTIYLQGNGALKELANSLNTEFSSRTINGVSVSINTTFVYANGRNSNNKGEGNNILNVRNDMEIKKKPFIMSVLNKLGIKILLLLFLTIIGCNKYTESYSGYAFVQVYYGGGENSTMNIYLLDQYAKNKSFDQNIVDIQKIKTIILTTDNTADLLQHIDSIRSLKRDNPHDEVMFYLVYVDFKLKKHDYIKKYNFELKLREKKMNVEAYHYLIEDSDLEFNKFDVLESLKGY